MRGGNSALLITQEENGQREKDRKEGLLRERKVGRGEHEEEKLLLSAISFL